MVGGDEEASKDFVFEALAVPSADRRAQVRALALEDDEVRRQRVSDPALLRKRVESYELALTRLIRGSVYFSWKWQESQLAEAVLELGSIEFPAQDGRQRWFVWGWS